MSNSYDFLSQYLSYVGATETPTFYHRWSCISMIGAYLGRQYHTQLGASTINPNHYCMLIGVSAARKSTAIKTAKRIIRLAGYDKISADKTSKEKFLLDLAGDIGTEESADNILDRNLFGDSTGTGSNEPCEMYINCDEFNDFMGNGNLEFISLLGNFWDYEGIFKNRIKNGKSVDINQPTISILGGNTPVNFYKAFPPDILGQGFFSRLLLIYGEPTGVRITWPREPDAGETHEIVTALQRIKSKVHGRAVIGSIAEDMLDAVYQTWKGVDDVRFSSYAGRRFTHLLKLCLVISASRFDKEITERDVLYANTILSHTEFLMPKALGEFGKSRNSDTAHKIVQMLESSNKAMTLSDLWRDLPNELENINALAEVIRGLLAAEKIFSTGAPGFLAKKKMLIVAEGDIVDYSLLTEEERNMTK